MRKLRLFFIIMPILFCPVFVFGAIAITPPNNFIGDGTLNKGTASLIKVNIIDEEPGTYYLKAYFCPPSKTSARFGFVWNPTTNRWISTYQKNSEQLQIEVAPNKQWNGIPIKGLWQGEISVKTDIEKSGYLGSEDYILKVRATSITTGKVVEISTKTSIVELSDVPKATNNIVEPMAPQASTTSQATEQVVKLNPLPVPDSTTSPQKGITKPADRPILLYLSEILPSPEGPDTENEFIEIFNANNFEADLSNWKIKDKIGAVKSYSLPKNTKIKANGFLVLKSLQTKISLNNTGDGVELLDSSGKLIDSTDFGKSGQGQSWSKGENGWPASNASGVANAGWQWTAKSTPGQINVTVATQANTTSILNTTTSSKEKQLLANIQNYPPQRKNLLAISIAVAIALVSAFIAWQIKKKSTDI